MFLLWATCLTSLSPLSPRPSLHQSQRRLVAAMFFVETPTWLSQYLWNQTLRYNTPAKQWSTLDFSFKFTAHCPFLLYYQDSDYAKPRGLSLATLFGFQKDHQSSKPDPVSPLATPLEASSPGLVRPPVARTLTYENALNSNRSVILKGGNVIAADSPNKGQVAGAGAQTLREADGNVVVGLPRSRVTRRQQDQEKPQQHCPAFQKLLQAQRGGSGGVGVLQTVSESPENRLCDNGLPVEHHHQPHFLPHPQHHHPLHQKTQQLTADPLKRLLQPQPVFPSSSSLILATPLCCSLQQNITSQPITVISAPCSHLRTQQSHQLCFEPSKPQTESLHNQSAPSLQDKGASA